jgi:hypothetical protein
MRRPRRLGAPVALLVAVAITACAPSHAVVVGDRSVVTDILLKGAPAAPVAPPPVQPGFPLAPVPVTVLGPAVQLPDVAPLPAAPVRCPTASPLVGPRDPATPLPPGPPVAATYTFRQAGTFSIGSGRTAHSGEFAPTLAHTISNVTKLSDGWSFVDTDSSHMSVTYDVYPHQRVAAGEPVSTDAAAAQPTEAGIYVKTFTYQRANGFVDTLSPQPELLVAPLPLNNSGATWRARGVDAATHIAVVVNGQVGAGPKFVLHDRIDACGTVLQAYWVEYTIASDNSAGTGVDTGSAEPSSSLQGPPSLNVEFVGTQVAFATQYGGIPLEQIDKLNGTDGVPVDIARHEVITQGPIRPTSS